jgi:hypothetical protein
VSLSTEKASLQGAHRNKIKEVMIMKYTLKNIVLTVIWIPLAIIGNIFMLIQESCEWVHSNIDYIQCKFDDISDK